VTNHLIFSKVKEAELLQWTDIETTPPYQEIEVLRALDQLEAEPNHFSKEAEAALYTMLAYHRLKRNHATDNLTTRLLDRANLLDQDLDTEQSLRAIRHYQAVIEHLATLQLDTWTIRETDFDASKLKKMQEWQEELKQHFDNNIQIDRNKQETKSDLSMIDDRIQEELEDLQQLIERSIEMLENKRSGVPTREI